MPTATLPTALLTLGLLGCPPADPGDPGVPEDPPLDVTEPMGPGEVRAGPILDDEAGLGGVAGEGRAGDFLIYNDRARFVIQGLREGSYTTWQGGSVIDADIVRPEGQPDRDTIDDWVMVAGNGHIMDPDSVWVVEDGSAGRATIRAQGPESPLDYVVGFFENAEIIPDEGLYFVTDYVLEPDSPLLEVTTTVQATDKDVTLQLGDILLGSKELSRAWVPGTGLTTTAEGSYPWVALVGKRNEGTLALLGGDEASLEPHMALGFVGSLLTNISGFGPWITIEEGESVSFTRYYGVGPDLASITDAWLAREGREVASVEGTISAPDGPVDGARVSLLADGAPWTMAVTDAEGRYQASVEAGAEVTVVADGRGTGYHTDLPPGAAPYGPYAHELARTEALDSMVAGATPVPLAQGRGWAAGSGELELGEPATLTVSAGDGLPFEARLAYSGGYDGGSSAVVQGSPSGYAALAWARDGELSLQVEPGSYELIAWRGVRWEATRQAVELEAGVETRVEIRLEEAYHLDDWLVADLHVHASPSPDGSIIMADRLVVQAGQGVQVHFGTDHDHVVDYNPLLEPLGLQRVMTSIVSCEVSPIVRGHKNVYPLEPAPEEPNNGAWPWWRALVESTTEELEALAQQLGDPLVQVNHPMDGLASLAGWSPGQILRGDYWCPDFHAIEVANGGNHGDEVDFWMDLAIRGLVTAPVATSDSHGFIGSSGISVTFLELGTDDPAATDPEAVREAVAAQRTVASVGPFLDLSVTPGTTLTEATILQVEALSPSWIVVDELRLLRDGELVETVAGTAASFELDPDADALFVVEAVGSQAMSPISGKAPWALSGPILFDQGADGWVAPLEPLEVLN
jgi:predicted metal-dependent phosphoesterase TrpH